MLIVANLVLALAAGDAARFHPAQPDLWLEVPDAPAAAQAYANAPLMQTLHDPAAARVGEVLAKLGIDPAAFSQVFTPAADPARPDDRYWPWSALTSLSVSFAGIDAPAPEGSTWSQRVSGWLVLDFADELAATQALRAIADSGGVANANEPRRSESVDGWVVDPMPGDGGAEEPPAAKPAPGAAQPDPKETPPETITIDGLPTQVERHSIDLVFTRIPFWSARTKSRIVVGFGRSQPAELAARLAAPETSFVAQREALVKDGAFPTGSGVTLARAWSDLERLGPAQADAADGAWLEALASGFVPFAGRRGPFRLQLRDSRFVWESWTERIGPARKLDRIYWNATVPAAAVACLPPDAVGAWLMSVRPEGVDELLRDVLARDAVESGSAPDAQPMPSLASGVGDFAAMFLMPINLGGLTGGNAAPNVVLALGLKDEKAFQTALEAWIARASAIEPDLKVESKPYHKRPMYTFSRAGTDDADAAPRDGGMAAGFVAGLGADMKPTLVVMPDRILVATSRQNAQSEVRRIEAAKSEPHALSTPGAIPEGAFEVGWMDWGSLVGKLYDAARAFLPMLAQGGGADIDASKLPAAAELFRFVKPSTSYTANIDGKQYTYAASSLGPETPLALVGMMYATTAAKARDVASAAHVLPGVEPTDGPIEAGRVVRTDGKDGRLPDPDKGAEPREITLRAMRDVKTGLAVYRAQFGRVPESLSDLLKGTDAFPHGFLEGNAVPKDGWNRALVYAATDGGARYTLRSSGPNGVDDQGGGDDVTAP